MRIKFLSIIAVGCCVMMFNGEAFARGGGGGGGAGGAGGGGVSARGSSLGTMTRSAGATSSGKMEQNKYVNQEKAMDQDRDQQRYKDSDAEKDTAKAKAKAKETKRSLASGKVTE
ncbi:MAG: hypothetical protein KKA54_17590 [Proteobacteria bacterium]|nr:hypothetical protein [Pseudomonadota bacterium]